MTFRAGATGKTFTLTTAADAADRGQPGDVRAVVAEESEVNNGLTASVPIDVVFR